MIDIYESNYQKLINSQDEWEEVLFNEGLQVIEIFQDWCDPCKPISKYLWKLKNELNDKILNFAIARADNVDSLERYRGRCEPLFLIYGNGVLVGVLRGCNPPSLGKLIKSKLAEEHLVLSGLSDRIEVKDPFFKYMEDLEFHGGAMDFVDVPAEVLVAIIKPDLVFHNHVPDIINMISNQNISILKQEERLMTEEEVNYIYKNLEDTEFYNDLVKCMTAGNCYFLILTNENGIINDFQNLIGPRNIEDAKNNFKESIRALYARSIIENAIHCAEDIEECEKELSFFYPDFIRPTIKARRDAKDNIQTTLAIIRPSAMHDFKEKILQIIELENFQILRSQEFNFNRNEAENFYFNNKDSDYYEDLILEMMEGKFLVLALTRIDAINKWRTMLGNKELSFAKKYEPYSIRAMFSKSNIFVNLIHGSDSAYYSNIEQKFFFPIQQTIGAIKPDSFDSRDEIIELINECGFKISIIKEVLLTKEDIKIIYKDHISKPYFQELLRYMSSGKCLFFILSKEDAVKEWRLSIGPTDPETAVEENPDYLRALYGRDILENAIYGCADKGEVDKIMKLIFGNPKFDDDGNIISEKESKDLESSDHLKKYAENLVEKIISSSLEILNDE